MTARTTCTRCGIPLRGTAPLHDRSLCDDCHAPHVQPTPGTPAEGLEGFVTRFEKAARRMTGPLNQPEAE